MNEAKKEISLSWLVVATRDYKPDSAYFWDKKHMVCYGIPQKLMTGCASYDLMKHYSSFNEPESYFDECVWMPELQKMDVTSAAEFLRRWCAANGISYEDDLDNYKKIEGYYWGLDKGTEESDRFLLFVTNHSSPCRI